MKLPGANKEPEDGLFDSIYMHYKPLLRVLAKRQGVPYDDTEDIAQETFYAYYSHYPLTWAEYRIRAMLCKILKNRCVDYLRRRSTHPSDCWDPEKLQAVGEIPGALVSKDTLTILLEQEKYQEVMDVLDHMKEEWAQVVFLYIIEGRPIQEVSKILGTTDAACRTRLGRARKYLKKKLKQNRMDDS